MNSVLSSRADAAPRCEQRLFTVRSGGTGLAGRHAREARGVRAVARHKAGRRERGTLHTHTHTHTHTHARARARARTGPCPLNAVGLLSSRPGDARGCLALAPPPTPRVCGEAHLTVPHLRSTSAAASAPQSSSQSTRSESSPRAERELAQKFDPDWPRVGARAAARRPRVRHDRRGARED